MFGLSLEKFVLVAIIAAFLLGPERLPVLAQRAGDLIRGLRGFVESSRTRLEEEAGMTRADWEALDPRRYDPRRIVREALEGSPDAAADVAPDPAPPASEPARVLARPSSRTAGSSGHPTRLFGP
ncbi:twin-arginine translocase TatA/TatE family subunit [Protaetiibacter intestinalis]|uniref:twin-arginine translocase TatA/TatE family subunit n=1 Tax=Protaetiibacter intestinalis TaxID=2419774 RepID=UPI001D050D97|nr:twin-arginine translocase TatA/TatE family subunit [Protaetiibacter intestinalis]